MATEPEKKFELELTSFGNGRVGLVNATKGRPASVKKTDNVTIQNAAIEATPAYFTASFNLGALLRSGAAESPQSLLLEIPIPSDGTAAPYHEIENAAAAELPKLLRSLADLLDADLERVAKAQSAQQEE